MDRNPLISIIIPVYNSEKFLKDTIASVLNQSYSTLEIIAINDGSTDSSLDILNQLSSQDSRIKVITKANGGVSAARNLGISKAKGDYLSFLDSDDLWLPSFLEKMVATVLKAKNKVAICGYLEEMGELVNQFPVTFYEKDILKHLLTSDGFRINTNCWLIDRKLLHNNELNFFVGSHYGEDNEFFCKVLFKAGEGNIGVVKEYLTRYMMRQDSLSSRDKLVNDYTIVAGYISTLKRLLMWFKDNNGLDESHTMAVKFKQLYINSLWDSLLLGTKGDYKKILQDYKSDSKELELSAVNMGDKKFTIWKMIIFNPLLRLTLVPIARYLKKRKRLKKIKQL